jgi:hypothetical protein
VYRIIDRSMEHLIAHIRRELGPQVL